MVLADARIGAGGPRRQCGTRRRERRQRSIRLFPLPVEQFNGHAGKGAHLLQDPLLLFSRKPPGFAPVGAWFGLEPLEAALFEGVIPIFERACGDELRRRLALPGQGLGRGHLFQRGRQGPMLLNQLDDGLNQAHAPQGDGLLNRLRCVFHMPARLSRRCRSVQKQGFVGWLTPCGATKNLLRRSQAAVVAQERILVVLRKKTEHLGHRVK